MKTIVLFIRNPIVKMAVIRILMKNSIYYMEASNMDELFIKLDLVKDAGLLIQDNKEDEEESDIMKVLFRANLKQLPVLWIIPGEKSNQISDAVKRNITDILLFPFSQSTLLRKLNGILHIQEDKAKMREKASCTLKLPSSHSEQVIKAMESAAKGRYPLCIIQVHVVDSIMEMNLRILDKLKKTLRQTDQVIEVDLGIFIILCPYTPQQGLKVAEAKIKDAIAPILQDAGPAHKLNLYSTNFPEDVKSYSELELLNNYITD